MVTHRAPHAQYMTKAHIHMDVARAIAKASKEVSITQPEIAQLLDSDYEWYLAEARDYINHAKKLRREK